MNLRPQSLAARVSWLVAVVGMLSLALHLMVMSWWIEPVAKDLSDAVVGHVRLVQRLLSQSPAAERSSLAAALSGDRFQVAPRDSGAPVEARDPPPLMPGRLLQHFRRSAGSTIVVNLGQDPFGSAPGQVDFDFSVGGDPWRVTYRAQPPILALIGTGLGWLILVAVAVFASLAWGVRAITRPLSRLASELASQGDLLRTLPHLASGGTEIRALVGSFNQLVATVQQADRTKQQLLAGVSHDLRTPLARLRLRIETQCDEWVADELSADLHAVERIVSQFLAYVQGDRRAPQGEPELVRALAAQVVADFVAQGQDVRLEPTFVDVRLPDLALQRLLVNLIDNALAHGAAPVALQLTQSARTASTAGQATLTVWDHGRGMTQDEFAQAQQPFVRLQSGSTTVGHCGLGLAIVAQIAHQLGGTLERKTDDAGRFGIAFSWPVLDDAAHEGAP